MDNISTQKLLLYYFNETEMTDSVMVQYAIDYDYFVAEEFEQMKGTFGYLDELMVSPQPSVVKNIMKYSLSVGSKVN